MEKKTPAQIEQEKKDRKAAIDAADNELKTFEIKAPEDVAKKFDLQKKFFELQLVDGEAKAAEKLEALNTAIEELKGKDADAKKVSDKLEVTIKALDMLQTRVKNTNLGAAAQPETKSFGDMLAEGVSEAKDGFAEMVAKKSGRVSIQFKAAANMTFPVNFSTAGASVTYVRPGIIELPKRKVHVRELLPGGSMGAKSTFDFVKEVTGTGTPLPASEGALKEQIALNLVEASVRAEWIAAFLRISRNMLDDVTGMTTFLQSRLPELLLREEDSQLLTGTGSSPNLSGILHAGNFTPASGTSTIDVEQLVQAVAQLEGYDREANGILLNPADWYNIWLTKSTGSVAGLYNLPEEMIQRVGDQMFIAGVPVYRSTAIAVDRFIVGDWKMGANFISREPMRVEFFYEDSDNVQKNLVTVRVEERVAFPIYGSDYFISGDFGNAAS